MSSEKSSSGIGLMSLLGIVFVVLKLTDVIDWSWWYVTMPFYGGIVLVIIIWLFLTFLVFVFDRKVTKIEPPKRTSKFQERLKKAIDENNNKTNK